MKKDSKKLKIKNKTPMQRHREELEHLGLPKAPDQETTPTYYPDLLSKSPNTVTNYGIIDYRPLAWNA